MLKANAQFFAFPWATTGTICVVPLTSKPSAIADEPPLISHEGQTVVDMAFNPFNASHLATAANDGVLRVFEIPAGAAAGRTPADAISTIQASGKRLLSVEYHPMADGVVLVTSGDNDVKLFDVAAGAAKVTVAGAHKGVVTSTCFSNDGALLVTTCKDKVLRVIDPRAGSQVAQTADHVGAKSSKAVWLRVADKIMTAGFTKTAEREVALFDPRKMNGRLSTTPIDASSAAPMIFQDEDLGVVYLTYAPSSAAVDAPMRALHSPLQRSISTHCPSGARVRVTSASSRWKTPTSSRSQSSSPTPRRAAWLRYAP